MPSTRLNWGFVMIVLFGFLSLIYTFDAVSGEREQRTLALCLSNSVKRSHLLLSKYIAVNILLLGFALIGMVLAMIILMLSPTVNITVKTLSETGLFLFFVAFFIGSMTAIGLFTSVLSRNSGISLLLSVSFWLLFLIAVPNISQTIGMSLHPVEKTNISNQKRADKYNEIEASFPDGKWSSNSGDPFMPKHEIRANMLMAFAKNDADFRAERIKEQFRQAEITRQLTWISPLAVFGYGQEVLLDGGLSRLQKNYNDLQNFKIQYLQWFKELDAKDEASPHWYNPKESLSTTKKPVAYEEIPQYIERSTSIAERFSETMKYLMVMLIYMGGIFFVSLSKFNRYNVT
jgi:ABC-type transport system involved in multi-copper enzyme maturation permease subunit